MPSVAIVGAGQSGLQLAVGLLQHDFDVTLISNREPEEIATGNVLSSQCMFESALASERALGLDLWASDCPPVEGISIATHAAGSLEAQLEWAAKLDWPAQSVDQRLKIPAWMDTFVASGGDLAIKEVRDADLERLALKHDLVVVASGKGPLADLFQRDAEKSPYATPQRVLALTYVTGMEPPHPWPAIRFHLIPDVGECIMFPALTTSGPCEILMFEGVPGGPLDCWHDVRSPSEHLARARQILERFLPREFRRAGDLELTDPNGTLVGRVTPTVREPVATLPSGARVFGMADALVLNDPVTGQGSNNAAKCAEIYLASILEQADNFDERFMQRTFDRYWRGYAQWVVSWTNALLAPPKPHVLRLLDAAAELPELADTIVNGFDDPRVFFPWWFDAGEADRLVTAKKASRTERFEPRELRRALGQFATGVTVVTTCSLSGERIGVTANSFTSLSLDPPLVLWCLGATAPSLSVFKSASHFAINVLSEGQHYLSRQFATPAEDKFAGVAFTNGPSGVPILEGVLAHFVCRNLRQIAAGDHHILIGEIERFETAQGEPLVFHSGTYRVATRHPDLDQS